MIHLDANHSVGLLLIGFAAGIIAARWLDDAPPEPFGRIREFAFDAWRWCPVQGRHVPASTPATATLNHGMIS